jgi:ribonucleoside-triphosphate reductase (formate)
MKKYLLVTIIHSKEKILVMFEDSSINASVKRVKNTLNYSLYKKYEIVNDDITEKILKLHGLSKDNFDFINNIEILVNSNLADSSLDTNANKAGKTLAGLQYESSIPSYKMVGYRASYRKIKELYGKKEAKKLTGEMYDMSLAIHDSGKILLPYCWAFDASKIVIQGTPWGQLQSSAPQRVSSYMDQLKEVIHQMASQLAGAIAIGTFFFDVCHILLYREKITLEQLQESKELQKYVKNCYQTFVHSVNNPMSRNNIESPFTNISVFDRDKLFNLLSDENMGWYFENIEKNYVVEYIIYLQQIYMNFFDKGDPLSNDRPYTFPITTVNLSCKDVNGVRQIIDKEFEKEYCKHDVYRYHTYVSEGNKISSCCRLISDADMFNLGGLVNSFGGSAISLGSHRVVLINFNRIALEANSYDDFFERLILRIDGATKILYSHRKLLQDTIDKGMHPLMSMGWIQLKKMFSTYGIIGLTETRETLKNKFGNYDKDLIEESLKVLNEKASYWTKELKTPFNIEQVPGESMAVRLSYIDSLLYGEDKVPYELYSNQFIPLWEDKSIWERMELDGKYQKLYTGGSICFFNLGEKTTATQNKKIIDYAIKSGCELFALNSVYSECEDHHNSFGKHEICPICGKKIIDYMTRVVGFFTRVSGWNTVRREWEFPRRQFKSIE